MRQVLYSAIVIFMALGAARADEKVARAAADSVSQFLAVAHYCPQLIPTDGALAERYADEFANIGRANTSPSNWKRMMVREGKRRLREVQVTGDKPWCENQRRFMEEAGVKGVLPR
jgi:hypothetical protein